MASEMENSQRGKSVLKTKDDKGTVLNENFITLTDGFDTQRVTTTGNLDNIHGTTDVRSTGSWTIASLNRRYYSLSKLPADLDNHQDKDRPPLLQQFSESSSAFKYQDPPSDINVKQFKYSIDPDSSTQIDIPWDPPRNAPSLKNLGYEVQLRNTNDTTWKEMGTRNVPVIRIYNTGDSVMLNKLKWNFKDGHVIWWLRIRGMVKNSGFAVYGPWCDEIRIDIKGIEKDKPNFKSDSTRDKSGNILF